MPNNCHFINQTRWPWNNPFTFQMSSISNTKLGFMCIASCRVKLLWRLILIKNISGTVCDIFWTKTIFSMFNSEYQPKYLYRKPYAHIINEPWYVAEFFMTCKRNIFNYWYAPNFVLIAGEYHITAMDGGSVPMHVMQLVGRMMQCWSGWMPNRGEFSSIQCWEAN